MIHYCREGISFELPEDWSLVADEPDDQIRSVSIDVPENGDCFLNIYRTPYKKTLRENFLQESDHFLSELPPSIRLVGDIVEEKDIYSVNGAKVEGLRVIYNFRTNFLFKSRIIETYVMLVSKIYTTVLRFSCDEKDYEDNRRFFDRLVSSYSSE